ncbi:MAG: PQQ-binding-like beta-propeller repeat protein [Verrucomicrobiota bacterium]
MKLPSLLLRLAGTALFCSGAAHGQAIEVDDADVLEAIQALPRLNGLNIQAQAQAQVQVIPQRANNGVQLQQAEDGGLVLQGFGLGMGRQPTPNAFAAPSGALKTDSESEALLSRADQFMAQERYDLASVLWQTVIDKSGDLTYTKPEWNERSLEHEYERYRPMMGEIEKTLGQLPAEGIDAYRIKADGAAQGLLDNQSGREREVALAEVVRRYFLSSIGDDAAFELACLKLDRGEFLPAYRLLRKLIENYPDMSVPREQIELRLAALTARVGDPEEAGRIFAKMKVQPGLGIPEPVLDLVEADILRLKQERKVMARNESDSDRLPAGIDLRKAASLKESWSQEFILTLPESWPPIAQSPDLATKTNIPGAQAGRPWGIVRNNTGTATPPPEPPSLLDFWKTVKHAPAGDILARDGQLYFKTHERVVCLAARSGTPLWLGFRNAYPVDRTYLTNNSYQARTRTTNLGYSQSQEQLLYFGDSLHQCLHLQGDYLIALQGKPLDFADEAEEEAEAEPDLQRNARRFNQFGGAYNSNLKRNRDNRIVVYDARNGKLLWMGRADANPPGDQVVDVVDNAPWFFCGQPVIDGELLIVPVYHNGSIWLKAFNPHTGSPVWKTFLVDEPIGTCAYSSRISLAIDSGDTYVSTGTGLIFSLDAISGSLNWAVRYPRRFKNLGTTNGFMRGYQRNVPDGWMRDSLFAHPQAIVVAPSDFSQIIAFDRGRGTLLWESGKQPSTGEPPNEYCLGIQGDRIFFAGPNIVRCYRVNGGRLLWETPTADSFGRGQLTRQGLLIPLENEIAQLDLDSGETVATVPVEGRRTQPLGNLYCHGDHLLVRGLKRVYALTPVAGADNAFLPPPSEPGALAQYHHPGS